MKPSPCSVWVTSTTLVLCMVTVMDPKQRGKEIQDQIRLILLTEWDPLGVAEMAPGVLDEYDSYIGGIYRLLYSHGSVDEVARHLDKIVLHSIGLSIGGNHLDLARKLCALNVRF